MEMSVRKGFTDGYCMLLFETVFSPLFVAECHCSLSGYPDSRDQRPEARGTAESLYAGTGWARLGLWRPVRKPLSVNSE